MPGRPEGDPLCLGRFSRTALEEIRRDVGPLAWAAEYQGTPRAQEGALFQIDRFQLVDSAPSGLRTVRFWDLAASARRTADFTVGAKIGVDRNGN
jgi:phage terminase large subunit-like protein